MGFTAAVQIQFRRLGYDDDKKGVEEEGEDCAGTVTPMDIMYYQPDKDGDEESAVDKEWLQREETSVLGAQCEREKERKGEGRMEENEVKIEKSRGEVEREVYNGICYVFDHVHQVKMYSTHSCTEQIADCLLSDL